MKQTNVICNVGMCPYNKEERCSKSDVVIVLNFHKAVCKVFETVVQETVWEDIFKRDYHGEFKTDIHSAKKVIAMKKYEVFEDGKPASKVGFPNLKGKGWETNSFNNYERAHEYAINWLGPYGGYADTKIEINVPYDYSGCGNYIEIREIEK